MRWTALLQHYTQDIAREPEPSKTSRRKTSEEQEFQRIVPTTQAEKGVPRLLLKRSKASNPILNTLQNACYQQLLLDKYSELLTNDELIELWGLLCDVAVPSQNNQNKDTLSSSAEDKWVSFDGLQTLAESLPEKYQQYFRSSVYLQLVNDSKGNITLMQFYNYVGRRASLLQARLELGRYDVDMDGYLTEDELQKYISDLLPTLNLSTIKPSFHKFYLCTATRKFAFFLDPLRRGKIAIRDIILSPILGELFGLRDELPKDMERLNWFSAHSSLRIYSNFLGLDTDHNGLLNRRELERYNNGSLNPVFLDRVYQELLTYSGEMDYRTYLDFVLALENVTTPQSMTFLFRILDVNANGFVDEFTLHYFLKALQNKLQSMGTLMPNTLDIMNEVFDIAGCGDTRVIKLDDLVKCGQGGLIISMLIDVNGFYAFEQRDGSMGS